MTRKNLQTTLKVVRYNAENTTVIENAFPADCHTDPNVITWIHIEGLEDKAKIESLLAQFGIHSLTIEDIFAETHRPKVDDYDNYTFITFKSLHWKNDGISLFVEPFSIIFTKQYVISIKATASDFITQLTARLQSGAAQQARKNGSDYLVYRLIDASIDNYFAILEVLGERIEATQDHIIESPTPKNSRTIYLLKKQMLVLRKVIWPLREVLSHLLYGENTVISRGTRVFIRDAYDHISQAIDTVETFRDMLSSLLDMYLSGLAMRTNEVTKTLTIIATIFMPITAIASIYGMNIHGIPLMRSKWGFDDVAFFMILSIIVMLVYFRRKKWL